ncbi:MAG: DUF1440 domain-containing protein [Chloroflexota bacterium]|nr:DUF1440 domain-containing protein [Chloroflexota bacterium]
MGRKLDDVTGEHQVGDRVPEEGNRILSQALSGALAGFMATVPMSAAMKVMQMLLPWWEDYALPPSQITTRVARLLGLEEYVDDPREHLLLTVASHFGYGTAVGTLYPLLTRRLPLPPLARGVVYGLVIWFVSYLGWLPAMRILPPATEDPKGRNVLMITAHLIWGGGTGLLARRLELVQ